MLRRAALIGAAVAAGAAATGCYWLTPYQDLTGRAGDAGPGDSSGGPDGAPTPTFCESLQARATPPTFCDDFDEGRPLASDWPTVKASPPSTVTVDSEAYSPPGGLRVSVPATQNGAPITDVAQKITVTRSLHIEFEVRADVLGSDMDLVSMFTITTHDASAMLDHTLNYYMTSTHAQVEEDQSPPFMALNVPQVPLIPIGSWSPCVVDLELAAGGGSTLDLSLGGVALPRLALTGAWPPGDYEVTFGFWWLNDSKAPWGLHFDDIAITAQ